MAGEMGGLNVRWAHGDEKGGGYSDHKEMRRVGWGV